jgi:cytoskeletal protein CcmA (bactofilin family)
MARAEIYGRQEGVNMAMFEQQDEKKEGQQTIIGQDVNLTGDLKAGEIVVRGKIKGQVVSSTSVFIEEGAQIDGSVEGKNVIIDGTIKGNVIAKEDLELNATAVIRGDILVKSLIIKKGAVLVGKCSQLDQSTEVKDKEEPKK